MKLNSLPLNSQFRDHPNITRVTNLKKGCISYLPTLYCSSLSQCYIKIALDGLDWTMICDQGHPLALLKSGKKENPHFDVINIQTGLDFVSPCCQGVRLISFHHALQFSSFTKRVMCPANRLLRSCLHKWKHVKMSLMVIINCVFNFQNELTFQDVIKLVLPEAPAEGPDGTKIQTIGKAFCNGL